MIRRLLFTLLDCRQWPPPQSIACIAQRISSEAGGGCATTNSSSTCSNPTDAPKSVHLAQHHAVIRAQECPMSGAKRLLLRRSSGPNVGWEEEEDAWAAAGGHGGRGAGRWQINRKEDRPHAQTFIFSRWRSRSPAPRSAAARFADCSHCPRSTNLFRS